MDEQFAEYASARYGHLLRVASLILGKDSQLAPDLVQESLARVYSHWKSTDVQHLDALVKRTMTNLAISRARSEGTRRRLLPRLYEPPASQPGAAEERDAIWAAIKGLPPRQRAVLVLHYYEDLDYSEIADLMNITAGTARSQCLRAREALRESIPSDEGVLP